MSVLIFLALIFGGSAPFLFAQEDAPAATDSSVDDTYQFISDNFLTLADKLDSFFGSPRTDTSTNTSTFRVYSILTKTTDPELKWEPLGLSVNLQLPRTQNRFQIVLEKKAEDPTKAVDKTRQTADQPPVAAVRFVKEGLEQWNYYADLGITLERRLQGLARAKTWRSYPIWTMELRPSQEFFYYFLDGFGESTNLDFDRPINDRVLFRFANNATWTAWQGQFALVNGPSLYHQITPRTAISYHAKVNGTEKPTLHATSYDVFIVFRQLIYKSWFYYEIVPLAKYPIERDWALTPSISFRLEVAFGSI